MIRLIHIGIIIIINIIFCHDDHSHQHGRNKDIGSIYGTVIDTLNNKPIEYVSISLFRENSNEIESGNITDSYGKFLIDHIPSGNYFLKIEFMGYKQKIISDIKINPRENLRWDAGTIQLVQTFIEIDEVNVINKKPIFHPDSLTKFKLEKKTYKNIKTLLSNFINDEKSLITINYFLSSALENLELGMFTSNSISSIIHSVPLLFRLSSSLNTNLDGNHLP